MLLLSWDSKKNKDGKKNSKYCHTVNLGCYKPYYIGQATMPNQESTACSIKINNQHRVQLINI